MACTSSSSAEQAALSCWLTASTSPQPLLAIKCAVYMHNIQEAAAGLAQATLVMPAALIENLHTRTEDTQSKPVMKEL